jgi:hypothetical protein
VTREWSPLSTKLIVSDHYSLYSGEVNMSEFRREKMDPKDIAELMDSISTKIPTLIKGVMESFYSPETAAQMGRAVAEFRKSLLDGGIPEGEAIEMTKQYMSTLTNLSKVMRSTEGYRRSQGEE